MNSPQVSYDPHFTRFLSVAMNTHVWSPALVCSVRPGDTFPLRLLLSKRTVSFGGAGNHADFRGSNPRPPARCLVLGGGAGDTTAGRTQVLSHRQPREAVQEGWVETDASRRGSWVQGQEVGPGLLSSGGQLVTHIGAPIMVSLANEAISFGCKISYPHTPELKDFTAWYFHVDLQSQRSSEKQINCSAHPVQENQTHSLKCWVTPQLPNASATGTYYCSVHWPNLIRISKGIFILVRDTGYREPPQGAQKLLLFCFTGLLTLLSILVTALLLWKKKSGEG
ncbi:NFAT activation molecule 1 isoform X2 [Acinonyx jubatus]|uniref:NFAT activation molecule 1 isoform X2 n=1 Tax=Acinonyx jubatus TaxID=32536 RepID=A0ABM3QFZ1_ACIJB|nr:NFAT activation molecule 1 isoform X2 [Acinonyx jubatus]